MEKTVGLAIRESIASRVRERMDKSSVYFFLGFNKVNSSALSQLRNQLRVDDSYVFVAKNSLIRKAFQKQNLIDPEEYLQGETGIIFVYNEDIVKACKTVVEFAKENESFLLKGGVIEEKRIKKEDLEELAKLPSREVLLAQAVSGIAAPLTGFLACLNQMILKFVWMAKELKKQRESSREEVEKKDGEKQEEKPKKEKKEEEDKSKEENKQEVEKQEGDKKEEKDSGKEDKEKEEDKK